MVVASADLNVHAINAVDGTPAWRVKPTVRTGTADITFANGWPVIAEAHGLVLVKMRLDWNTMWTWSPWPTDNATIRSNLQARGPAVPLRAEPQRRVDPVHLQHRQRRLRRRRLHADGPRPAVKRFSDGTEVVYTIIRGKQGVDGRWDSMFGEMMLDGSTVPGLLGGYVRWINYNSYATVLTDEEPNVSMSGDDLFGGHWMAGLSMQITDRSNGLGSYASPITTVNLPHVVTSTNSVAFSASHYTAGNLTQDGNPRTYPPGFYIYYNQGTVYDNYWSEYATWTVSNGTVYWRSCDGAIVALENGNPLASAGAGSVGWPTLATGLDGLGPLDGGMARWIPARAPRTISYLQARDYAGQDATVTGRVQYVFNNGKTVLLGFQRPHAGFFKVQIPKDAWPAFVGAGLNTRMGRDLAGLYREGQDIRVTGRIEWYQGDPAIYVRTPGQIGLTQSFAEASGENRPAR